MLRNLIHSVTHIRERVKEKRENEVQTGACCSLLTYVQRSFLHRQCFDNIFTLFATSEVGHHRGRVKKRKERNTNRYANFRLESPFDGMVYTARRNAPMRVIRTQILRTSTFYVPSTMLGWYFYSTPELGHHRECVKSADANFRTNIFR